MRNIFKNKNPELTPADRMKMIAELDAETREHERIMYEYTKKKIGNVAIHHDLQLERNEEENTPED